MGDGDVWYVILIFVGHFTIRGQTLQQIHKDIYLYLKNDWSNPICCPVGAATTVFPSVNFQIGSNPTAAKADTVLSKIMFDYLLV